MFFVSSFLEERESKSLSLINLSKRLIYPIWIQQKEKSIEGPKTKNSKKPKIKNKWVIENDTFKIKKILKPILHSRGVRSCGVSQQWGITNLGGWSRLKLVLWLLLLRLEKTTCLSSFEKKKNDGNHKQKTNKKEK